MQGLVAVVTGANRGLGFLVSKKLLEKGAQVVFTARDVKQEQVIQQFKKEGLKAYFHQLDVTNEESIKNFVKFMEEKYKHCNILCNNAGVYPEEWNESVFKSTMQTNLIGVINLTMAMLPMIKASGKGRIVNVSSGYGKLNYLFYNFLFFFILFYSLSIFIYFCSVSLFSKTILIIFMGLSPFYRQQVTKPDITIEELTNIPFVEEDSLGKEYVPVYKLTKAAINSFSSTLANKLKSEGFKNILVNSVDPGWCQTDMGGSSAPRTPERGAESIMYGITLEDNGPSGQVFFDGKVQSL